MRRLRYMFLALATLVLAGGAVGCSSGYYDGYAPYGYYGAYGYYGSYYGPSYGVGYSYYDSYPNYYGPSGSGSVQVREHAPSSGGGDRMPVSGGSVNHGGSPGGTVHHSAPPSTGSFGGNAVHGGTHGGSSGGTVHR